MLFVGPHGVGFRQSGGGGNAIAQVLHFPSV